MKLPVGLNLKMMYCFSLLATLTAKKYICTLQSVMWVFYNNDVKYMFIIRS